MFTRTIAAMTLTVFCFAQDAFALELRRNKFCFTQPANLRGMQDEEANAGADGQQNPLVLVLANAASRVAQPVIAAARGAVAGAEQADNTESTGAAAAPAAGAKDILALPIELKESIKGIARRLIERILKEKVDYEEAIAEAFKSLNEAEQKADFPVYSTSSELVKAIREFDLRDIVEEGIGVGDWQSAIDMFMAGIKDEVTAQNHRQFGNRLVTVAVICSYGRQDRIVLEKADDGKWTLPERQALALEDIADVATSVTTSILTGASIDPVSFKGPLAVITNPAQFEKDGSPFTTQPYSYTIVTLTTYSGAINSRQGQVAVFDTNNLPSREQINPNYYDVIKNYLQGKDLTLVEPSKTVGEKVRVDKGDPRHALAARLVSEAIADGAVPPVLTIDLIVNLYNPQGEWLGIPLIIRGAERPDGKRPDRWMREIGKLAMPGGFMENANTPEVIAREEFNTEVTQYLKKSGINIKDFVLQRLLTVASSPSRDDMLYTWSIVFEAQAVVEAPEETLSRLREGIVDLDLEQEVLGCRLVTQAPREKDTAFDHSIILEDYFNERERVVSAPALAAAGTKAGAIGLFKKRQAAEPAAEAKQASPIAAVFGKADTGITGKGYDRLLQQMRAENVLVDIRWKEGEEGINTATNRCRVVSFDDKVIRVAGKDAPAIPIIHRDKIYFIGTDFEQAKQAVPPQAPAKSKATGNIRPIKEKIENGIAVIISPDTVLDPNRLSEIQKYLKPFGHEFKEIVAVSENNAEKEIEALRASEKTIVIVLNDTGNALSETIMFGVGKAEIIDISGKEPSAVELEVKWAL